MVQKKKQREQRARLNVKVVESLGEVWVRVKREPGGVAGSGNGWRDLKEEWDDECGERSSAR